MDPDQLDELAVRLSGRPVPGARMGEQEFIDWSLHHADAEWADGEIILMVPENDDHNDLGIWLARLFGTYAEGPAGGAVRTNMMLRLPRHRALRVPDLMYFTAPHRKRIRPTFVEGPPDLIIEIVSPDSQNRDRREKYLEYKAGGVREYWIIDPMARTMDAFALRGRKYEPLSPVDDRIDSRVLPGVFLRTRWLFGKDRPKVAQVLKEFGVKG